MKRAEAIASIVSALDAKDLVFSTTGMISRELYSAQDRPNHFYMIGSMGLASSVALGAAIHYTAGRVVVLDGDGSFLMNVSAAAMAGRLSPRRFFHVILDNGCYESTGSQPSFFESADWCRVALGLGYREALQVPDRVSLQRQWPQMLQQEGPSVLWVRVSPQGTPGIGRVEIAPDKITERFARCAGSK